MGRVFTRSGRVNGSAFKGFERLQAGGIAGRHAFNMGLVRTNPDARSEVIGLDFNQGRYHLLAGVDDIRTASMKATAGGGSIGEGTSPSRTMRCRAASTFGSGTGTAEMSAFV